MNTGFSLSWTLAPLQSMTGTTVAFPAERDRSHGVSSPSAFAAWGIVGRAYHLRPIRLQGFPPSWRFDPPRALRPCFRPMTLMGFRPSEVFPSGDRRAFRRCLYRPAVGSIGLVVVPPDLARLPGLDPPGSPLPGAPVLPARGPDPPLGLLPSRVSLPARWRPLPVSSSRGLVRAITGVTTLSAPRSVPRAGPGLLLGEDRPSWGSCACATMVSRQPRRRRRSGLSSVSIGDTAPRFSKASSRKMTERLESRFHKCARMVRPGFDRVKRPLSTSGENSPTDGAAWGCPAPVERCGKRRWGSGKRVTFVTGPGQPS